MTGDMPLREGEAVRWIGRPDPKRIFTASDWVLVPFSIVFTALGLSLALGQPGGSHVLALVFVTLLCGYLLIGRFFVKAHRKSRTRYFITTTRAVIMGPRQRTYSFEFGEQNPHIEVIRSGGHLTLRFTSDDPRSYGRVRYQWFANTGLDFLAIPGRDTRVAFDDVPRTIELEAIVDELFTSRLVRNGIA